ncbi:hypothetical protein [Streptomyces actinomycinicus]
MYAGMLPGARLRAMFVTRLVCATSRRSRIAHLKNWRALAPHLGRREHMSDTAQAIAALLSHQQTADLIPTRHL